MSKHPVKWAPRPAAKDIEAAGNYLRLLYKGRDVGRLIKAARSQKCSDHIAKDILRACDLPLLPKDEKHVGEDLKRISKGKSLAPIVLIQGDLARNRPLIIADGYHRMCAACHVDEDTPIRAVLVAG